MTFSTLRHPPTGRDQRGRSNEGATGRAPLVGQAGRGRAGTGCSRSHRAPAGRVQPACPTLTRTSNRPERAVPSLLAQAGWVPRSRATAPTARSATPQLPRPARPTTALGTQPPEQNRPAACVVSASGSGPNPNPDRRLDDE